MHLLMLTKQTKQKQKRHGEHNSFVGLDLTPRIIFPPVARRGMHVKRPPKSPPKFTLKTADLPETPPYRISPIFALEA
jgi:hypothetical protein